MENIKFHDAKCCLENGSWSTHILFHKGILQCYCKQKARKTMDMSKKNLQTNPRMLFYIENSHYRNSTFNEYNNHTLKCQRAIIIQQWMSMEQTFQAKKWKNEKNERMNNLQALASMKSAFIKEKVIIINK